MLIKELLTLREAASPKMSHAEKFSAMKAGEKPDAKTVSFLEKLCTTAEKLMMKQVLLNPDLYGIDEYDTKKSEIRGGTNIHTTFVEVHENGFCVQMMVDTDDIGGSSDNHEDLCFDTAGKPTAPDALGKAICDLNEQDGFACE